MPAIMQLDQWRAAGRSFTYRNQSIFYRDDGNGPALLCIHGFPTSSWDWAKVWPALTARFRVVAADMIGFGFSDKPETYSYSIDDQASLQEELLAHLGIAQVDILAHDYGDSVAQELLARYEERRGERGPAIRSVCFLNGGLFPESHRMRPIQRLLRLPLLGRLLSRSMTVQTFVSTFPTVFGPQTRPSAVELHDFWTVVAHNNGHAIAYRIIRYIDERRARRDRWVGALQSTGVPLRFIDGPEDPVSGRHMGERYLELIPGGDVVYLEGIGHYPQVEDPEGMLRAFFDFQDKIAPRP
jgi:pimeloyl-ACP methyl ester carboxylesterase